MFNIDAPIVRITPSKSPYITKVGPDFLLHCSADGIPSPSVQWYKDGQPFTAMTLESSQDVYISRSSSSDSALYECVATNYPGNKKEQRKAKIDFQGKMILHGYFIDTYSIAITQRITPTIMYVKQIIQDGILF